MKKGLSAIAALLFGLLLTACAQDNANDDTVSRTQNSLEPTRVNYNNTHGSSAISSVDTSDPELDRNQGRHFNRNMTNVQNDNRVAVRNNQSKIWVADVAAERIADLPEVDHANIIVTDNNAYVAAKLDPTSRTELPADIKKKITQKVKSVDHNIDNVYVSINPDFYIRMSNFSSDIRNGRPVSGFINEFSDTIRRVFPDAK